MEWIKTILPLIGVALGWLLAESGKVFTDKRQDKRKLKKLLFFLLELRFCFAKELSIQLDLDKGMEILLNKMADKFGMDKSDPELNIETSTWKPFIEQILMKSKNQDDKFEYLSGNIDKILIDLAEIFPILAYELSGQHNIKERLNKVESYYSEIESMAEAMPFDFKKWINPKLTKELIIDLDDSIEKIAKQIGKQTLQISKEKIAKMTFEDNNKEIDILIDEYLNKIIENIE